MTTASGEAPAVGTFKDAVAEELRVHMTRKRITGRELARRLHVSSQWISQRTRAVVPLDADDMEMIAGALGISVFELLADAARRASNGDRGRVVTGVDMAPYPRATSRGGAVLSLITGGIDTYGDVTPGYGSTAADAHDEGAAEPDDPYLSSRVHEVPSVPVSAGTVNNAHAA